MADYTKMKNSELENLLKERKLPHNGRKAEMVARLQEDDKTKSSADPAATPATETAATEEVPAEEEQSAPAAEPSTTETPNDTAVATEEKTEAEDKEEKPATTFSANLASTSLDDEIARRKKRAEKFGMSEEDTNALKNLERQKRFGTGPAESSDAAGVSKLDEALSAGRAKGGKRAREEGASEGYDDPGLKRQRGRGRGRGRGGRGPPRGGRSDTRANGKSGSWMSEADKAAAEKRKAKFG